MPGLLGTLHSVTGDTRVPWVTWNTRVSTSGVFGGGIWVTRSLCETPDTLGTSVSLGPLEHLGRFEHWGGLGAHFGSLGARDTWV